MTLDFRHVRDRLVMAALPHAVFDGWSARTLAEAARDEGLDPTMPDRAFPGGPAEAVEHFVEMADRVMLADLAEIDLDTMRVPDRVFTAVKLRLERWGHHRDAVRRAMSVLALNPMAATRATLRTVDAVWRAAGDSSHDFSWYTKRATLAAVYSATVLYWLEDPTEDYSDTWAFLKRRLADVGRVTKTRRKVEEMVSLRGFGR
jgi:ubiquinone biosynthesis protein COQ9